MDHSTAFSGPPRPRVPTAVAVLALAMSAGCSQNPYFAAPGGAAWQTQQTAAAVSQNDARIAELSRRVQLLDDNNRQLHTQLAQSEQQSQVYRDEAELLRSQLAELSQRLESTTIAARAAESQVRGMQASTQLRGNATIQANTNLSQLAGRLKLGVPVVQDGEVIRILVPSDQLFQPGTATLHAQASSLLDPISAQLRGVFPRQRIGIEGYTDNAQLYGGAAANSHQLTSSQATAVLEFLTRRGGLSPQQLFTVGQGSNNPRQSNQTAAGRAANRRIELVIYPESL